MAVGQSTLDHWAWPDAGQSTSLKGSITTRTTPRIWLFAILTAAFLTLAVPGGASAATCPNANPVVNENQCQGAGTTSWHLTNFNQNGVAGFATRPSFNLGSPVPLAIGSFSQQDAAVDIWVYRVGWYGGTGARLVNSATNVPVGNSLACDNPQPLGQPATGLTDCSNWSTTYTIPASALPVSGVYVVRIRGRTTGYDNQIVFVVRDDARTPKAPVIFKLATATYQAYNAFGNKSLYDFNSQGANTVVGTPRAAKVSFARPIQDTAKNPNWLFHSDFQLISWMERQGYDISYTESQSIAQNPSQLLGHKVAVVSGHDEYWSGEELQAFKAARDAGVNIASFSSNTAYWKIRYEDNGRTIVCYKTVQGAGGNGALGVNDPGPDGVAGTADDALGADGIAGTADDHPENATTTFRDDGAAPGSAGAPPAGRVGPNTPENALWGVMYVGDNDAYSYQLAVPAGNGQNEFAADRIWRRTGIPSTGATVGHNLLGWEWDGIPTQPQYLAQQPAGVTRLTETNTLATGVEFVQDEGRVYASTPPPGQPAVAQAVKYRAPSGALVFSAGTNQWAWGLAPHWLDDPGAGTTYSDTAVDSSDPRIQQATYNIFSDMGVQPDTPSGITVDGGNQAPTASFTVTPSPAQVGQQVTFDASASADVDGTVKQYEWDLDGNGTYETNTGSTPTVTKTYNATATLTIGLRVTDDGGAQGTATRTLRIAGAITGAYGQAVVSTAGLEHYWRLDEPVGPTFADVSGSANASATSTGVGYGIAGALSGDSNAAASFNGSTGAASAPVDLSGATKLTVEFWLKWSAYANDDHLAMEFTPNFNTSLGGFLVDPNAPQNGGAFGVGFGDSGSRNNVYFSRPSAGAWHHYAFVFDTTAAPAQQITPYVDGVPVSYTKTASGSPAAFTSSTLNFMSRNASALFGAGSLDEVALYRAALSASTIAAHYAAR